LPPPKGQIKIMEKTIQYTLYLHILVGGLSLLSGAVAIFSKKGDLFHKNSGKLYFWAMTLVFISGIIVAGYRSNRFLFLIAFLSYYSVFAGVRVLKLKQLHKEQGPKMIDWFAGLTNAIANLVFIGLGIYFLIERDAASPGALLSIGFGVGGLMISYVNLKQFVTKPEKAYHWYLTHIGNMMGGYIATLTAFLSTIVTRFDLMNPFLAFALPSIIGVPLIIYWNKKTEMKFKKSIK